MGYVYYSTKRALNIQQEEYKHEIPKCQSTGVTPHPKAKDARINLTFRVARQEYCDAVPLCKCNVPADLRVVSKKEHNYGRYFYICAGKGNVILGLASGYSCGFFQWLVVPEPRSQDVAEQIAPICID